jgi:hypothetical protein
VKSSDGTLPRAYCTSLALALGTVDKATYELDSAVESDGKVPYSAEVDAAGGEGVAVGADADRDRSRMKQTTMPATRITKITAPTATPTINALSGGLLKATADPVDDEDDDNDNAVVLVAVRVETFVVGGFVVVRAAVFVAVRDEAFGVGGFVVVSAVVFVAVRVEAFGVGGFVVVLVGEVDVIGSVGSGAQFDRRVHGHCGGFGSHERHAFSSRQVEKLLESGIVTGPDTLVESTRNVSSIVRRANSVGSVPVKLLFRKDREAKFVRRPNVEWIVPDSLFS